MPVKLAEEFLATNPLNEPQYWSLFCWGQRFYRAGQFEQPAERLKRPSNFIPAARRFARITSIHPTATGDDEMATGATGRCPRLLSKTLPAVEAELQSPKSVEQPGNTRTAASRGEALIEPKKADEAVENKTPDRE